MGKLPTKKEYINAYNMSNNSRYYFAMGLENDWYGLQVSKTLLKRRDKIIESIKKLNKEAESKLKNNLNWVARYDLINRTGFIQNAKTPEESVKYIKILLDESKNELKNNLAWLKQKKASIKFQKPLKVNARR